MKKKLTLSAILYGMSLFATIPVKGETINIEDKIAQSKPLEISVVDGKASMIIFNNDQKIIFVLLPDQSRSVYTPNSPIESGEATALYLRKIKSLNIPGATESSRPNLLIETKDTENNTHQYEFNIDVNETAIERDKITIQPALPAPEPKPKIINTIQTTYGVATPEDIRLGLETSIKLGKVQANGLVAKAVNEYIALTLNGVSAMDALATTQLPMSVVEKLGSIGQQEDAKRRILPLEGEKIGNINKIFRK